MFFRFYLKKLRKDSASCKLRGAVTIIFRLATLANLGRTILLKASTDSSQLKTIIEPVSHDGCKSRHSYEADLIL